MKRTCTALLRRVASTRPTTCINRRGAASLQHRVLFNAEPAHAWRATFCTEAKAESTPAAEEAEAAAGGEGDAPAEKTPEDIIADLEAEVKELQDSRLRLLAEMENVRKIARNDVERAQKFAAKKFAKSLLDIADNLDRAMECVPEDARTNGDKLLVNLYEGVKMTEDIMLKVFSQNGIARFGQVGDEFDPKVHNALYLAPPSEDHGPNKVANVVKTGFMFHDLVLRPAEVGATPKE